MPRLHWGALSSLGPVLLSLSAAIPVAAGSPSSSYDAVDPERPGFWRTEYRVPERYIDWELYISTPNAKTVWRELSRKFLSLGGKAVSGPGPQDTPATIVEDHPPPAVFPALRFAGTWEVPGAKADEAWGFMVRQLPPKEWPDEYGGGPRGWLLDMRDIHFKRRSLESERGVFSAHEESAPGILGFVDAYQAWLAEVSRRHEAAKSTARLGVEVKGAHHYRATYGSARKGPFDVPVLFPKGYWSREPVAVPCSRSNIEMYTLEFSVGEDGDRVKAAVQRLLLEADAFLHPRGCPRHLPADARPFGGADSESIEAWIEKGRLMDLERRFAKLGSIRRTLSPSAQKKLNSAILIGTEDTTTIRESVAERRAILVRESKMLEQALRRTPSIAGLIRDEIYRLAPLAEFIERTDGKVFFVAHFRFKEGAR